MIQKPINKIISGTLSHLLVAALGVSVEPVGGSGPVCPAAQLNTPSIISKEIII